MQGQARSRLEVSNWSPRDAMFAVHGVMLVVAFILLFPAGVSAINSNRSRAFKYHWIVQLTAFIFTTVGVIIGLVLSPDIRFSRHKQLGVIIAVLLAFQLLSGWRHHITFSKIHQRTWVSTVHIWLGRFIIGAGWCNFVTGLSLGGFADRYIYLAAAFVCFEAITLTILHCRYHRVASKVRGAQKWTEEVENHFALRADNSDGEE